MRRPRVRAGMDLRAALLVAVGAAVGALARWGVQSALPRDLPYGTLAVNVLGSFAAGFLLLGGFERGWLQPEARLALSVGVLGGFTTMSGFAYETLALWEGGKHAHAVANALANPLLSLAAALAGRFAALA